jgi:hypothetical protein
MAVGSTTIDFGSGNQIAEVTVSGQTGILAGSKVEPYVMAATLGNHTEDAHLMMQSITSFTVPVSRIVAGTSFVIVAFADQLLYGQYTINWVGDYT